MGNFTTEEGVLQAKFPFNYGLDRLFIYQYNQLISPRLNSAARFRRFLSLIAKVPKKHMPKMGKRLLVGRGKGYMNAAGPQYRFIIFLIILLISYTILLRVFQKLAEIVQLPIFLPIALVTLLVFIGIVGILYSHTFVGPMVRLRRALEQLAEGETHISLRLRESDDPTLKELARAITLLCEHSRNSHVLVQETSQALFGELAALQEALHRGADKNEIRKRLDEVQKKQHLMDKATKSLGKS
jgi:methyl-accepting chemotaxis protein